MIVHIIAALNRGGAEGALRRLVERQAKVYGASTVAVITLMRCGAHGEALRELGIEVLSFDATGYGRIPCALIWTTAMLRRLRPSIVQTWMVHADIVGGLAARLAGVPRVIWGVRTTDYSVESRPTRAVRWLCARFSSIIPDRIVCVAQAARAASLEAGYDETRMMVIPNGFDLHELQLHAGAGLAIRNENKLAESALVVGCLGRYNPAKDHASFVEAGGRLAARYSNVRFLMVGKGLDWENLELVALIEATGFRSRFVLLGERADPAACLDAMDVFALSSCAEAFPNVLGEAMAMGVPCVTTAVGDAELLLGDAGEVVPPRDPAALAVAVGRLIEAPPETRLSLGASGRWRIETMFSIEAMSQRYFDLYLELLGEA